MPETCHQLAQCLAKAIGSLLQSRTQQGHWGDTRSTALAVWAFNEVIAGQNARPGCLPELRATIRDATAWLIGQARREDGGYSWESEAWDTSLAILALVSSSDPSERVDQAVAWLQRIRDPVSGTWYDEIWETTLATVALLRAERSRQKPVQGLSSWLEPALNWFLQIPSKPSGEFVCPHYSGFLAWILAEVLATRLAAGVQNTDVFAQFKQKTEAASSFLLSSILTHPWSSYTFANAYAAYGLTALSRTHKLENAYFPAFVKWMLQHQGSSGGFEDTEDTAIAVAALSTMLDAHEEGRRGFEELSGLVPKPSAKVYRCFLGYSGIGVSTWLLHHYGLGRFVVLPTTVS
jgi:hypothetical protein